MSKETALTASNGRPKIGVPSDVPVGKRVPVRVTHYSGPTKFFLRYKFPNIRDAADTHSFFISRRSRHVRQAIVGMYCFVCKAGSKGVALRALVMDVHRNHDTPWTIGVRYVDSGLTDTVGLNVVYAIDGKAAAEPCRAVPCYMRGLGPARDSTHFDLPQLTADTDPLYEAVFLGVSDTGAYEVDLYVECPGTKVGLKMLSVSHLLIQNGFARSVVYLDDGADTGAPHSADTPCQDSGERPQKGALGKQSSLPLSSMDSSAEGVPSENSLEIEITLICTPELFYGHIISAAEDMSQVHSLMRTCKEKCTEGELVRGAHCIYRNKREKTKARVWVEAVLEPRKCRIFFVDYGSRRTVKSSRLYKTDISLDSIDPLALRFELMDIKPWSEWTDAAVSRFEELAGRDATLTAVLTGTKRSSDDFDENVYVVKLFSEKHGNVAECLCREGYARLLTAKEKRSLHVSAAKPAQTSRTMKEDYGKWSNNQSVNKVNTRVATSNAAVRGSLRT
ncbi:uncharacterized protein LOC144168326 [Haemaphysalis longicornis]